MAPPAVDRFLLRLPRPLHRRLRREATVARVSLNELCVRRLSLPPAWRASSSDAARLVARADDLFGPRLRGIVLHGSWVRGTATAHSDVDALVVVEQSVALTRALYREWDAVPLRFGDRPVDVHVVHLPDGAPRPGVWCDAAIDGLVLHDLDGAVNRWLARVRVAIADGRIVRRIAQGHPYWIGAA